MLLLEDEERRTAGDEDFVDRLGVEIRLDEEDRLLGDEFLTEEGDFETDLEEGAVEERPLEMASLDEEVYLWELARCEIPVCLDVVDLGDEEDMDEDAYFFMTFFSPVLERPDSDDFALFELEFERIEGEEFFVLRTEDFSLAGVTEPRGEDFRSGAAFTALEGYLCTFLEDTPCLGGALLVSEDDLVRGVTPGRELLDDLSAEFLVKVEL